MEKKFNFATFIGIDISKKTLDLCITDCDGKVITQEKIENTTKSILSEFKGIYKRFEKANTLICYENTGIYTNLLNSSLVAMDSCVWMIPAIEIKRSLGIKRGKSDKADAKDIALYGLANQFKFNPYSLPSKNIQKLKLLKTEREKLIESIKQLKMTMENIDFFPKEVTKDMIKTNAKAIQSLEKCLMEIESQIKNVIEQDEKIKNQMELIKSIPGIGHNTALYLILATNQFQNFKEWRQMACYAGVAPFEYTSGTSIRGRNKVSHLADKKLKSLLHMCAMISIRFNKEIKVYYDKKKKEGKHSLLVLNNIKAKLLARIFAVVNRNSPFVEIYNWAA